MHLTLNDRALLEPLLDGPMDFGPADEARLAPYRELKIYGLVRILELADSQHRDGRLLKATVELTPRGRAAMEVGTHGGRSGG